MDTIYLKLWEKARPYYLKGRQYDVAHVEWLMQQAQAILLQEKLNEKLLMPLVILHDVGYSVIKDNNPNVKDQSSKVLHMQAGAKIAAKLLKAVDYEPKLSDEIVYYISVHDNWVLDDDVPFQSCKELAVLNDLDFLWTLTSLDQFKVVAESMRLSPQVFFERFKQDEKLTRRPFCTDYTRQLFVRSMLDIKKQLQVER